MYNNNQWTQSRFNSFIKSALRAASSRWPPKYGALNAACVGVKINIKTVRKAKHYKCAECSGEFPAKEVQVDHIYPVIDPLKGFTSWDEVIKRMFCEVSDFQILCKPCHIIKTNAEKQITKERKTNDKSSKK